MTQNGTFLFAEDKALKSLLQGITVSDLKEPTRPVKVWFGYPDVELRQQEYPYMVIELYDVQPANDRQSSGFWMDDTNRGSVVSDGRTTYSYYAPQVYDLYYQVSSYSRNPRHDRTIIFEMMNKKVPGKYGHLVIPSDNEDGTAVARHMFLEGFVKRDTIEDGRRLFRNVFNIRVVSEMTIGNDSISSTPVEQVDIQPLSNNNLDFYSL
jgi:hypothetical protein